MLHLRAASLVDTRAIAAALAGVVRAGDVVVLAGEMGAGKTAFAQGFGAALGVAERMTSPTFTLVHSYSTASKVMLHHADIYRLSTHHEVADLALDSLGLVEMLFEIEDRCGFQIEDPMRFREMSFADMVAAIETDIRAHHGGQMPDLNGMGLTAGKA